jgi:four helix bundle protein
MPIQSAKDLIFYQKAHDLSMRILEATKDLPSEECYALTGQIRRSSRTVCNDLREAWAKRMYPAHFISKLTDCAGENGETDTSLDFARDCGYRSAEQQGEFTALE